MTTRKPLSGKTFCFTGTELEERRELEEKVEALGGTYYSDLMSDVHYLVVSERYTSKYNFCIRYRVRMEFIAPESIAKLHKYWIDGEEDGSENLNIDNYILPIFSGLQVCFGRLDLSSSEVSNLIDSCEFRHKVSNEYFNPRNLMALVKQNGGIVSENLTHGDACFITTERRGNRYTEAVNRKMPIIHPIWIYDSIIRGGAMRFEDYLIKNDPDEVYRDGCKVWDLVVNQKRNMEQAKRSLLTASTTASPTEVEVSRKITKKKNGVQIWNSIIEHTKKNTNKLIPDKTWDDDANSDDENANRTSSAVSIAISKESEKQDKVNQLFLGFSFMLVGFTSRESSILTKAIENLSGELTTDSDDDSITHIVIPASKGSQSKSMLSILPHGIKSKIANGLVKIVTEWFVERSMYYKKVMTDRWCFPMKGLKKSNKPFKICISGFTGIEQLHIEKLIQFLNFEFCESLTSERDLLVLNINLFKPGLIKNSPNLFKYKHKDIINCPTYQSGSSSSVSLISSKNKINAAKKWKIPIVSLAYLWEILELSQNSNTVVMPDILDLQWCIFAPDNYSKPKSLLEYVNNLSEPTGETDTQDIPADQGIPNRKKSSEDDNDSLVKLPSPRKGRSKQKYGRLVGREHTESMTNKIAREDNNRDNLDNDVSNIDEDPFLSQIGYQDAESLRNEEAFLKKLEEREQAQEETRNLRKRRKR
ncbi:DPB11 [[Candida] subhashii]|uniref:DPB11 n=1 Tax=[Candida] subhashii TaxID=561895 RepID=A0A8J5USK7_9ASCO|nr:DPB11 [[Candida] subhashii]KAG7665282.1 DPB11 [[Candida] subhashii]